MMIPSSPTHLLIDPPGHHAYAILSAQDWVEVPLQNLSTEGELALRAARGPIKGRQVFMTRQATLSSLIALGLLSFFIEQDKATLQHLTRQLWQGLDVAGGWTTFDCLSLALSHNPLHSGQAYHRIACSTVDGQSHPVYSLASLGLMTDVLLCYSCSLLLARTR